MFGTEGSQSTDGIVRLLDELEAPDQKLSGGFQSFRLDFAFGNRCFFCHISFLFEVVSASQSYTIEKNGMKKKRFIHLDDCSHMPSLYFRGKAKK